MPCPREHQHGRSGHASPAWSSSQTSGRPSELSNITGRLHACIWNSSRRTKKEREMRSRVKTRISARHSWGKRGHARAQQPRAPPPGANCSACPRVTGLSGSPHSLTSSLSQSARALPVSRRPHMLIGKARQGPIRNNISILFLLRRPWQQRSGS